MQAFKLLRAVSDVVLPSQTKVHLACTNPDGENPLYVYREGQFDKWQEQQTRRNFERDYVLSLIQLPERARWLFVGVYLQRGSIEKGPKSISYILSSMPEFADLAGRMVVKFDRLARATYRDAETVADKLLVHELRPEPLLLDEFPGFKKVHLSMQDLTRHVRQGSSTWRAALSSVAGVYLVSDPQSGKLYVGSATGEGGIWARWSQYVDGKVGGNKQLRDLVGTDGVERADCFLFSVLEIADTHTSAEEVLTREGHWKRVLLSREHGHNRN
jgi:hypothetical protein